MSHLNDGIVSRFFLVLMLFFWGSVCHLFPQNMLTTHYTASDGLPSSTILDIVQDQCGMIWVATPSGMSCYDGITWRPYTTRDGLPSVAIIRLTLDQEGQIWALADTLKLGICVVVHRDDGWESLPNCFQKLFAWNNISGFQILPGDDGNPVVVVATAKDGLFLYRNGEWVFIGQEQGLSSNRVNGIAVHGSHCYVATGQGLSVIDRDGTVNNKMGATLNFPSKNIKSIAIEEKNKFTDGRLKKSKIWFLGDSWLASVHEDFSDKALYPIKFHRVFWSSNSKILPDYRNGVYFGNSRKLHYFDINSKKQNYVGILQGLISEGSNSILIDFEKNVWIAGNRGLTKIAGRHLESMQTQHGLLENEVTAILEYEPGKFVLGHNYGLTFYDGEKCRKLELPQDEPTINVLTRTLDLKSDSQKNIWAAMAFKGLLKLTPTGKLIWYGEKDGIQGTVNSVWIDQDDRVWVCNQWGLHVLTERGFVPQPIGDYLKVSLRKIEGESKSLKYLLSSNQGVFTRENKGWKNHRVAEESGINNTFSIKKDSKNRLLVGTLQGLYMVSKGSLVKFKEKDFEISKPVFFILEDRYERLWFGTDDGVIRWDGKIMAQYSTKEGLIGHETNRAAGIFDSSGKLWIGTNRGVSIFNEAFEDSNAWKPLPKLKWLPLEVNNEYFSMDTTVRLKSHSNNLVFHFMGISLINEKALRFMVKLEGLSDDWSNEQYLMEQSVRYNNLPPGTYRFFVKAKSASGLWTNPLVSSDIIILTPLYKRWWFILIAVLLFLFFTYGAILVFTGKRQTIQLERQVAERTSQVLASEKKYRALFENSPDAIFATSQEGNFMEINPSGRSLFGYDVKDDMTGVSFLKYCFETNKDRRAFVDLIQKKGVVKDFETRIVCKNGEKKAVLISSAMVPGSPKHSIAMQGFIRDITEKERLREQLNQSQKMEAIGTLAGGIAHDFNNILSIITGYVELSLFDSAIHKRLRGYLDKMNIAINRAKEVIQQILTFSRKSSQKKEFVRLGSLVEESLDLLRSTLPSNIEIRHHIHTDNDIILANTTQIQQVLMNLCSNSAHSIAKQRDGFIEVTIDSVLLDQDSISRYHDLVTGQYIKMSVSDNGHGMSQTVLKRIFEPYFSTKKKGAGTGMGLAVTYGIIKNHNGDVTVSSKPRKGTNFDILFPLVTDTINIQDDKTEEVKTGNGEHILYVDDESLLVEVQKKVLEKLKYRVTALDSSTRALEIFSANPASFDLVITDLGMPAMNGFELSQRLKKIRADIPIILCSGYGDEVLDEQLVEFEISEFLKKPVNLSSLADAVKKVIQKRD